MEKKLSHAAAICQDEVDKGNHRILLCMVCSAGFNRQDPCCHRKMTTHGREWKKKFVPDIPDPEY